MGKMSLNKGQNFERQVAKIFSDWSGVKLVRTPLSGAWEGCEVDIWPENPEVYWPLAIECKKAESWNMDQVMEGVGPVYDWLKQAEQQAKEWGDRTGKTRIPVLVFSRNRRPTYVAIPTWCMHPDMKPICIHITSFWSGNEFVILNLSLMLAILQVGEYALQREDSGNTLL